MGSFLRNAQLNGHAKGPTARRDELHGPVSSAISRLTGLIIPLSLRHTSMATNLSFFGKRSTSKGAQKAAAMPWVEK